MLESTVFSEASLIENSDSFSLIQLVIEQLKLIDAPKQGCRYIVNMVKTAFLWQLSSPDRQLMSTAWSSVDSMVEWLKHRAYDEHGLGSRPTRAIMLSPWERHFTALSPVGGLGKQL